MTLIFASCAKNLQSKTRVCNVVKRQHGTTFEMKLKFVVLLMMLPASVLAWLVAVLGWQHRRCTIHMRRDIWPKVLTRTHTHRHPHLQRQPPSIADDDGSRQSVNNIQNMTKIRQQKAFVSTLGQTMFKTTLSLKRLNNHQQH